MIRSSIVPRELGKRASGLVQPWRAWSLNLVLRQSWLSVLVSISSFVALASTAHVGSQQQLSSSACYLSSPRTACPTLSPPLRRPRSTVPPLALTFLINNDEYHQECREGLHGPLRDGLAGRVWEPHRRSRGFRGPSASTAVRNTDCSSFGLCAPFSSRGWEPWYYGWIGWTEHGGDNSRDGGGRAWQRASLRRQSKHDVGGLWPRHCGLPHRVRSCKRHRECPVFLSRISSDSASIDFVDGAELSMAPGGDYRKTPVLLCGRGLSDLGGHSKGFRSPACQGHSQEEGDHSCPGRTALHFVPVLASDHRAAASPPSQAVLFRDCTPGFPSGTSNSPSQEPLSSQQGSAPIHGRLCQGCWSSPSNQIVSHAQECPAIANRYHCRGTRRAHLGDRSGGLPGCSPCQHQCGDPSAEPGYECTGGPLGEPGLGHGFILRPEPAVDERSFQEGETSGRPCKQERQLLPSGGSERFEEDQTYRPTTCPPRGPAPKSHLLKVLGAARGFCSMQGGGADDVAVGPSGRCHGDARPERSPRTTCANYGDSGAGGSGRWKMGSCLCPVVTTGSTPDLVHFEECRGKPPPQGVCTAMPTRMGNNDVDIPQGARCHHSAPVRSPEAHQGEDSRGGETKSKKEAEVSKEASRGDSLGRPKLAELSVSSKHAPGRPGEASYLGSEPRACKGVASAKWPPPTWESLQSFSFSRWCSSLCPRVLASRTPFGAYLKKSLQILRWESSPAKLLFPLPVPQPGVFDPLPARVSSRRRRKIALGRALHVVVMALNFVHADCEFRNLDQLARPPNHQQKLVFVRIRGLLKAFGNQAGEISVPASGRRSIDVVSLLSDLSEFVTIHGLTEDSYQRGCPPFDFAEGDEIPRDLSRAEELSPYRDLDPQRLKISGQASWDPTPFLDDSLRLPFLEPKILEWKGSHHDYRDLPDLSKEDAGKTLELARIWDSRGLLSLSTCIAQPKDKPACLRVFNAWKSSSCDRQIGDRRGRNQIEGYLPGPSRSLPSGWHLACLEADPSRESIVVCISDRKDYYHQLKISRERAETNKLWPPLPAHLLHSTRAYAALTSMLGPGKRRRQRPREVTGDGLAAAVGLPDDAPDLPRPLPFGRGDGGGSQLHVCFNSIIQGDHLGVEIATQAHRGLLIHNGLLSPSEELRSTSPFEGDCVVQGLVIDDFFVASKEKADLGHTFEKEEKTQAKVRFDLAQKIYKTAGLAGSAEKDVINSEVSKVVGAELDSSASTRALGVISLGAPAKKRLALSYLSLELSRLTHTSDALHASLLGGWTSCMMYRRQLTCIFDHAYKCFNLSLVDKDKPRLKPLPRPVAQELCIAAVLAPLMASNLAARTLPKAFATDASDKSGAYVEADIDIDLAKTLLRTGARKGGYHRMMNREEALKKKLDEFYEDEIEEDRQGWCKSHPSKPLALHYHFIEVCGGAGKITKCLADIGWTCGPVLDLERSPHFDLSNVEVLSWIYFMLEQGRLYAVFIAPPCTTFSAAAWPCLRSYRCPRGFRPKDPRTKKGTELALRAIAILFLCYRISVIALLEQPRRSKMAWLREWVAMLEHFAADETWLASCNFNSPHQKEFRLLGVNLNVQALNHPCTRDHSHVKIEGKYTKPSATYTDALAARFAQVIDEALSRKLRVDNYNRLQINGLESLLSNDVALTAQWKVKKAWNWRQPRHINIQEAAAFQRLCYELAEESPNSRFPVGLDSNVALSAIIKGRSPSHGLRPALRKIGTTVVVGCLYPAPHFFPTRINPSDHPTRGKEIPEPSTSTIRGDTPSRLYQVAKVANLRRFAANWARLVLLTISSPCPWWGSSDSWRFTHYDHSTYPCRWISSQSQRRHQLDFDATLGFPGEGPYHHRFLLGLPLSIIIWLGLWLWTFADACFAGLCFVCLVRYPLNPLIVGCCFLWGTESPSLALAGPADFSHGRLDPRSAADAARASRRKDLPLDDGRPVLEKTRKERKVLLEAFSGWLETLGTSLDELLDPSALDIEAINMMLERYGRQLYQSGRPYNHYAETINAVSSKRPSIRRMLQGSWDLAYTWLREEPPVHHVALPWQILLAVVACASLWGWFDVAAILCLSWGGLARIGEVLKAQRKHLILPIDIGRTERFILLQIEEPKTRFKAARHQVARVDHPQLVALIEAVFQGYPRDRFLWGASPQTLRLRFQKLLGALQIDKLPDGLSRGLDLGSLRAGGASWLLLTSEDSELVRRRGRWISHKIMEVYVQEAAEIQFLPRLDKNTRDVILNGAGIFPHIVSKIQIFAVSQIPETAWKALLIGDARFAEDGKSWVKLGSNHDPPACGTSRVFFGGKRREGESLEMLTLTSIDTNLGAQSLPSSNSPPVSINRGEAGIKS